jgi:hypothetical protein
VVSELSSIVAAIAHPAAFVIVCCYLPRAILMLRAGWIALEPPPSGKMGPGRVQADKERRDRALAVLRTVCKGGGWFSWWNRPDK